MPLTVLSIAFPFAPVGADAVGGAEQILGELDQALVAAGARSLVVACEASRPAGELFPVPLPRSAVLGEGDKAWCRAQLQTAMERALAAHGVDLIHMHGLDFYDYRLPPAIPVLVTLHMPLAWYPPGIWSRYSGKVQFCCVSPSQRRSGPPGFPACAVVENGVPLQPHVPSVRRAEFAVVMGRICPEKNAHDALEAGTEAGLRVLLAGHAFPYREHQQYLQEEILPRLHPAKDGVVHTWLGPLPRAQRQKLLAQARCLLHPTLAPETSSLVAMEALAAGTPVIAYPSGALPEIIEEGVTGYLVSNREEMAAAIRKVHTISSAACRRAAEQRFDRRRMIDGYFALYQQMLGHRGSVRESYA